MKDGIKVDRHTLDLLSEGFDVKTNADYGPYEEVEEERAKDFVQRADVLVAIIESELSR